MTNLQDALVAVEAGADAVGFVFYEKSPRNVSVETTLKIIRELPERVEKVGVFVGTAAETVAEISKRVGLTVAQIYPRAPFALDDEFVAKLPCRVMPALSARAGSESEDSELHISNGIRDRVLAELLDSGSSERPGGTGQRFDWNSLSGRMTRNSARLVVAGGLTPENVSQAIEVLNPWGVDVVSGVEASPGKKDPEKVRAFVRAVREYDRKVG